MTLVRVYDKHYGAYIYINPSLITQIIPTDNNEYEITQAGHASFPSTVNEKDLHKIIQAGNINIVN